MAKKSPIGFNAALKDSEEKEIEKDESPEISRVDIDDIVEGVMRVMAKAPEKKNGEDGLPVAPYKVFKISK